VPCVAFGASQSWWFLRHFLELGMNDDERGRARLRRRDNHVAGTRKVFANHRLGMPGRTATQHEDRLYPKNGPRKMSSRRRAASRELPPIAVPLGTCTGWNLYRARPVELADRDGSFVPFARTQAEREAADDPRPPIEERYGSGQNYVPDSNPADRQIPLQFLCSAK
jgi:hypothetical protein